MAFIFIVIPCTARHDHVLLKLISIYIKHACSTSHSSCAHEIPVQYMQSSVHFYVLGVFVKIVFFFVKKLKMLLLFFLFEG